MTEQVLHGDCIELLREMPADSVHAVVTDPPYDLVAGKKGGTGVASVNLDSPYDRARIGTGNGAGGFMGKAWDSTGIAFDPATWREALRVLKPGGHLLAFGGTRTHHRMMVAIEDAGFEMRDCLMWVYGSGFPKSLNLDGEWDGWGTALKPAWEPIILARKPLAGTVAANVEKHGTGALNIDGCRIAHETINGGNLADNPHLRGTKLRAAPVSSPFGRAGDETPLTSQVGRWPANVIHDGSDEVVSRFPAEAGAAAPVHKRNGDKFRGTYGAFKGGVDEQGSTFHADDGSAARFFYCAKASPNDRNDGMAAAAAVDGSLRDAGRFHSGGRTQDDAGNWIETGSAPRPKRNTHPTVKPTELMRWLVRLVTPPGGIVLDPFAGSGSTGKAAKLEGFNFIGCEREAEYVDIARARIAAVAYQGGLL